MKSYSFIRPLLFLSILSVFYACQKESNTITIIDGVVHLDLDAIQEVKSPYTINRIVALETKENNLLGEFLTVKTHGEAVYIYDGNARDAIHYFDLEGKYHGKAVEIGEGPGMVTHISDFVPTDSGLEVLIGLGESSRIMVFDRDFELIEEIEFDYPASSFEKSADGTYAFSGSYNLPFVQNRLTVFNADGERLHEFLPNDYSNEMMPMSERNFHNGQKGVFFHEAFNPVAYEINNKNLEPRFQFDFGRYDVPSRFWEVDIMQGSEMLIQNGFAAIYSYRENGSTAFLEVYVQQGEEVANHQVMWDHNSQKATKRIFRNDQSSAFYSPIGFIDNQLVFIAQAAHVLDLNQGLLPDGSETIDKDDNPILVFADF